MLNENLAKTRKERGLTQEALAVKLNVVRQTVSKWEKGTAVPDADTLCKIADALEVSVSNLLGNTQHEEHMDTAAISTTLAQINEQLAIRNRRTARIWKLSILILLAVVILIVVVTCQRSSDTENLLPDDIEASDVYFSGTDKEMVCTFVPSIVNTEILYTVSLYSKGESAPILTVPAEFANGICTAVFDKSALTENAEYSAVLTADCNGDVRSLTLADVYVFPENAYSWETQWD